MSRHGGWQAQRSSSGAWATSLETVVAPIHHRRESACSLDVGLVPPALQPPPGPPRPRRRLPPRSMQLPTRRPPSRRSASTHSWTNWPTPTPGTLPWARSCPPAAKPGDKFSDLKATEIYLQWKGANGQPPAGLNKGERRRGNLIFEWFEAAATDADKELLGERDGESGAKRKAVHYLQNIVRMRLATAFKVLGKVVPPALRAGKELMGSTLETQLLSLKKALGAASIWSPADALLPEFRQQEETKAEQEGRTVVSAPRSQPPKQAAKKRKRAQPQDPIPHCPSPWLLPPRAMPLSPSQRHPSPPEPSPPRLSRAH